MTTEQLTAITPQIKENLTLPQLKALVGDYVATNTELNDLVERTIKPKVFNAWAGIVEQKIESANKVDIKNFVSANIENFIFNGDLTPITDTTKVAALLKQMPKGSNNTKVHLLSYKAKIEKVEVLTKEQKLAILARDYASTNSEARKNILNDEFKSVQDSSSESFARVYMSNVKAQVGTSMLNNVVTPTYKSLQSFYIDFKQQISGLSVKIGQNVTVLNRKIEFNSDDEKIIKAIVRTSNQNKANGFEDLLGVTPQIEQLVQTGDFEAASQLLKQTAYWYAIQEVL